MINVRLIGIQTRLMFINHHCLLMPGTLKFSFWNKKIDDDIIEIKDVLQK
jgi:hypothetical protein